MTNCRWCKEESETSLHLNCESEMEQKKVIFCSFGIRLKDEKMTIVLKDKDIPKKEFERIHGRDKTKVSKILMMNKWLEPIDEFLEKEAQKRADKLSLQQSTNLTTNDD